MLGACRLESAKYQMAWSMVKVVTGEDIRMTSEA